MKDGKVFNPEYPDHFLDRVRSDGLFDGLGNTKADVKVNEATHVVDVTLTFGAEDETKKPRASRRDRRLGWAAH